MTRLFTQPGGDQVRALLQNMVGQRVVVVGDVMLDHYLTGDIGRISQEAPIPVFDVGNEQYMLGGAANVAKCLVALGAQTSLCAVVGQDANAQLLRDEAANIGVDAAGLATDRSRPTTVKSRIVAQQQQVMRIDRESAGPVTPQIEQRLIKRIEKMVAKADAVILSDYSKGVLTGRVCRATIKAAGRRPVIVDPKDLPWDRYRGATLIKPNQLEASWYTGRKITDDQDIAACAKSIAVKLRIDHVLVTRGQAGMTLLAKGANGRRILHQLAPLPRDVFDSTGAGDMVSTLLALALAGGTDAPTASWLANVAAAIEVSKFGTAVVSDSEILDAIGGPSATCEHKIMSRTAAAALAKKLRRQHKKVVFTNGCFDILHVGHVQYLQQSRQLGDALIVGVNTDASIRKLKGAGRPVQSQHDRARILASQACVDAVVLFSQDTPHDLIKAVQPDILTKGSDYKRKQDVVGWDLIRKWNGQIHLIDLVKGRSTTRLIAKAQADESK